MCDDEDHDLTGDERGALAVLSRAATPPSELEERVVEALGDRGLIRRRSWKQAVAASAALAASVIVAFALGLGVGAWLLDDAGSVEPNFALFVLDPVETAPDTGGGAAVVAATEWANELSERGILVGAARLREDGRRLVAPGGDAVLAADFPPGDETLVVGGLFLIRAETLEEAQRIARQCPLLRFGSTIEVRAFANAR